MSKYILVVDDNPSDLVLSSFHVEKAGFIPIQANDAFSALDQIDEYDFKMMIVDLQMPKMSGIELIKRIRNIKQFKNTPIMVTSARQEAKDVKLAVQVGANDYLVKPLDSQIFEEKFQNLVGETDEWTEYTLGIDQETCAGFYKKMLIAQSISEVGATLLSDDLWPTGRTFEMGLNILVAQGVPTVMARVASSQAIGNKFILKVSFVGLTEETRKKIRLICRELWKKYR